jgi:anti-anti-sigma factor
MFFVFHWGAALAFSATTRVEGSIAIIDVTGRLTSFEVGGLRDVIRLQLQQGRKDIVLNLNGLQYLDSSGIGELAREYVVVVKQGGQMKVVGLTAKVEEVFKITHLYQVFQDFSSEEDALRSFPGSGGSNAA